MECTFVVHQKVNCIIEPVPEPDIASPKLGGTYTIREVFSCSYGIGLRFFEIRNKKWPTIRDGIVEPGFHHRCFRPVTDLLADFMIKQKQKVPEDA